LVGIGLVEFTRIKADIHKLIDFIAPSLGRSGDSSGYILAILLLFTVSGFLSVYIVTRAYVGVLFAQTEQTLRQLTEEKASEAVLRATELDAETKSEAPDFEPAAEVPVVAEAISVARLNPPGAAALAGARIIEAIQTLYALMYSTTTTDMNQALQQLRSDGYIDTKIEKLGKDLLELCRSASTVEGFTATASTSIVDATDKFLRSLSRTASINFEGRVEEALKRIPGAKVERRPTARGKRVPDFVVTIDGRHVVVESYLPPRPQRALLLRRIDDRRELLQPYNASALVVVLPDGIAADVTAIPATENVTVTTISALPKAISPQS
jgi:hypothetical protein